MTKLEIESKLKTLKSELSKYKTEDAVVKIAINGSFGKLGSKYSKLFAPELLIQTTITGQLALLMLIERITSTGAKVVSANTDGIVIHCHKDLQDDVENVAWDWTLDTTYELERTDYRLIASRDVNSYCAVKLDGKVKGKGVFAPPSLAKNPDRQIVYEAVMTFLSKGVPVEQTILNCKDITKFVMVRRVQGGGSWGALYLGKAVRYYKSTEVDPTMCINYTTNSNKVPNSDGCRPCMDLPKEFPNDVNYDYYIKEANDLLKEVGFVRT